MDKQIETCFKMRFKSVQRCSVAEVIIIFCFVFDIGRFNVACVCEQSLKVKPTCVSRCMLSYAGADTLGGGMPSHYIGLAEQAEREETTSRVGRLAENYSPQDHRSQ